MSDPSDFSSKTLDVVLLLFKYILRDKQRERAVLDANLLNVHIEPVLDFLPDGVRSGLAVYQYDAKREFTESMISYLENKASRDIVVVQHITLGENLLIPPGEVLLLGHIDTDQSRAITLLALHFGCGFLGLRFSNTLVHILLGLVRCLLGQLSGLLSSVLGDFTLRSGVIGGAIREGRVGSDRVIGGGLAGHCFDEVHESEEDERL